MKRASSSRNRLLSVDSERAECGEGLVVTHLASHGVSSRKTANRSRSFCMANRIRVFTVPSGCPV